MSLTTINDPRHWLDVIPETLKASALYTALWEQMKHDAEMIALVDRLVNKDQPILVTFFTGVNSLVFAEPDHPFARFYPYLHRKAIPTQASAYPLFREFVQKHQEELEALLPGARLQTNEATRCANVLPAFFLAYQRGGCKPLNMIEIGSSAGLNLRWELFRYQYGGKLLTEDIVLGERVSPVSLYCTVEGPLPPLPETGFPRVASCQGIDVQPRDIFNEQDMRWVRAAIWPEELRRHEILTSAIRLAQQTPMLLHQGDTCDLLPRLLTTIPDEQTAVIWHSYAIHQGPVEVKERILQHIRDASYRIPIYRVSLEFLEKAGPTLEWYEYRGGAVVKQEVLARCTVHGERMEWLFNGDTL
jgi:hypothetical protein